MKSFRNQVVWITGASSGIGEALAYEWGREGARLILSSNEPDELSTVVAGCRGLGVEAESLFLDLADWANMPEKASAALNIWGKVDILVNNGGISQRSLAKDTGFEVDRRIMYIDYFGHVALTKALLPSMIERRSGHIVVTTSVAGLIGIPLRSAYCAAKHALHGFFESLEAEVWRDNIKVTLVAPAAVKTKISVTALTGDGGTFGQVDDVISKGIPPEECARQVLRAVAKGRKLILPGGGQGKWGVYVHRVWPGLYRRLARRARVV